MLATSASLLVQLLCPLSCLDELVDTVEVLRSWNNHWDPSAVKHCVPKQSSHVLRSIFAQIMKSNQSNRS